MLFFDFFKILALSLAFIIEYTQFKRGNIPRVSIVGLIAFISTRTFSLRHTIFTLIFKEITPLVQRCIQSTNEFNK